MDESTERLFKLIAPTMATGKAAAKAFLAERYGTSPEGNITGQIRVEGTTIEIQEMLGGIQLRFEAASQGAVYEVQLDSTNQPNEWTVLALAKSASWKDRTPLRLYGPGITSRPAQSGTIETLTSADPIRDALAAL